MTESMKTLQRLTGQSEKKTWTIMQGIAIDFILGNECQEMELLYIFIRTSKCEASLAVA